MVGSGVQIEGGLSLDDLDEINVVSAQASMQVNCQNGMGHVFSGSVPNGASMQLPLNAPYRWTGSIVFPDPGVEVLTWVAGWVFMAGGRPTHVAGKKVIYDWRRQKQDTNPANDFFEIVGRIEE